MKNNKFLSKRQLLVLTALGIVYGDIGTSPLYAIRECFHGPHAIAVTQPHVFGVLSLVFWSLILVISLKYLQFVTKADNKGEGGVLALTALACLQKGKQVKYGNLILLSIGLFGAALLVGDGIITPAISVLSAIEGFSVATPVFDPYVIPITIVILIGLFSIQKHGTAVVGRSFGPIMLLWFSTLAVLGVISILKTPEVLLAINPLYAINFIVNSPNTFFLVLGAIFLVVTGGEALYADMGHVGRHPIFIGWYFFALPGLLLNYFGQGALILRDSSFAVNPFYYLVPSWGLYPLVILATCTTVIASQAVISGLFSLARQCIQLGYCPRLQVIHTSSEEIGQIYVPPVNWFALAGTIWLVFEFKSSSNLAAAYGIAVSITMVITTLLATIVAYSIWGWSLKKVLLILAVLLTIDLAFAGANFLKIADGGWVPLTIAAIVFVLMTTWNKGRLILIKRLREHSYPFKKLMDEIRQKPPARVSGCAIFMVGDAQTTPPALIHNLTHNKVLHETVVFLTIVSEELAKVPQKDRIEITKLENGFFRIVGRYGFMESPNVMALLKECADQRADFSLNDPTFFLGRELLISTKGGELPYWRKKVFSFLSKNSRSANEYFKLPFDRVIEVGMQIRL